MLHVSILMVSASATRFVRQLLCKESWALQCNATKQHTTKMMYFSESLINYLFKRIKIKFYWLADTTIFCRQCLCFGG
jgi:hypothetical protein